MGDAVALVGSSGWAKPFGLALWAAVGGKRYPQNVVGALVLGDKIPVNVFIGVLWAGGCDPELEAAQAVGIYRGQFPRNVISWRFDGGPGRFEGAGERGGRRALIGLTGRQELEPP